MRRNKPSFKLGKMSFHAFNILKDKLTKAPVIIAPDWNLEFELMCDANDYAVGAVLGQRIDKKFRPIYYATYTDHSALKYLFSKQDAKPRLIRLEKLNKEAIRDSFPDEHLMAIHVRKPNADPWTAYKPPINSTPFKIVYGKACHLPIEIEHKAYWALRNVNLDLDVAGKHRGNEVSQESLKGEFIPYRHHMKLRAIL
ncbi:reverse transcriptase domain-containing protein, partial [Tanacetum coccineum]